MDIRVTSREQSCRDVKLTTHLHLVPRLRMRGAVPLQSLHTFMVWDGENFTFLYAQTSFTLLNKYI